MRIGDACSAEKEKKERELSKKGDARMEKKRKGGSRRRRLALTEASTL